MNVRDITAQSDARAAQNLKREACQATRAPVIELLKPCLFAHMQVPRERRRPNMMTGRPRRHP